MIGIKHDRLEQCLKLENATLHPKASHIYYVSNNDLSYLVCVNHIEISSLTS